MKTIIRGLAASVLATAALVIAPMTQAQDKLQPYVLAYEGSGDLAAEVGKVKDRLTAAGFEILGSYQPYADAEVIGVTSASLKQTAAAEKNGAFAAVVRVAVTLVGGKAQVSYQHPTYMAAAYRLDASLEDVAAALKASLGAAKRYGTAEGRSVKDLKGYHYLVGMEYFDDFYQLAKHKRYEDAVKTVEANLAKKVGGAAQVYKLEIPGKQVTVFGVSRAAATDKNANDKTIMADTVDKTFDIKTTAYLPYEIVVDGKEVRALHMRFRMAVWHPDLTMVTFGKIVASPAAIEALLKDVAGGAKNSTF